MAELVYGSCVAFGPYAAILRGESGSGKSDLALRCLSLVDDAKHMPRLVADDQVNVRRSEDGLLHASPPKPLENKMEVRGLGIIDVECLPEAQLVAVCDLVEEAAVPRMPPEHPDTLTIDGVALPIIRLAPFHASAAMKVRLAVLAAASSSIRR
ncbi:aldolase [Methyloligella sp. 2.7D]|uniref:HPr kinase/phosphorylase n=1 Tax=unclassified Methyloligella TaxID=2625955 RepID=UPI00157D7DA2|nr:aldolase [Methyloligella sp. GL2]QKP76047.1 aldolase [Methyloligella sp. GL2]